MKAFTLLFSMQQLFFLSFGNNDAKQNGKEEGEFIPLEA